MVGGTRFHRWIHEASLGRNAGKRKDSFREEGKKRALAARTVYVSLDRADAPGVLWIRNRFFAVRYRKHLTRNQGEHVIPLARIPIKNVGKCGTAGRLRVQGSYPTYPNY